ncbi:tape measure protein [Stutzerimonas balearica]|uniref:tape measure protein n=1 Tax=Stutzerimonas balearica TaxID=74829 RepID=UPI00289C7642|nr:tape measure protein [Stutzerimonas balearica]
MTEYARLVVAVDSRQVPKATSDMDRMAGAAGRLENVVKSAGAAVIGMVSIQAIRSAQRLSEQFVLLEARVRRMSESADQAEITYGRLAEIARKSGTDMGDTVRLWESLTGTLRELGANDAQIVRLTETLQKIGTVGGSSAEEMSNALRQLGQGLAGGTLRAEEFNAIVEGMPELARQIAKGLGVPFGELRQLMQDGELTAERVLGAIQKRAMDVDAEFAKLPRTVAQASTALTNDLGNAISALDKAIGGSSSLAKFLDVLAKGIRFTAGDLTDFERLNELTAERASLEKSFEQAQRRTLLSAKEREAYEKNFARINSEIKEIQDRRIEQQKQESQQIKSDAPARNEQYDKYLAKLEESAALQGVNSEASKVRYAIESGELGKLLPEQEAALLKYAEEIDAKRSAEQATKELANSSKQLEQSYTSLVQSLERQLSMYGATSEAAKVRYELESGSLQGVVGKQAKYLLGLAKELDAKRDLSEQEKIRIDILRESGQLRAANDAQFELEYAEKIAEYERQGNVEALQRLETLRRIREVQMNADQAPGTVEGVSRAPQFTGLDASVGGAASELIRLQAEAEALEEWRATELEKQRGFLEAKAINEQEHASRVKNINEQAYNTLTQMGEAHKVAALGMFSDLTGNAAAMMEQMAGKGSTAYKALFLASKAAAIAQTIISTEVAAAKALELGPIMGIPAASLVRGLGYASVGMIAATSIAGMAHDGIDSVPKEGTWLLDKGERVVDRRTNADLKEFLADGRSGGGKGDVNIPITVTVEAQPGMSEAEAQRQGSMYAQQIENKIVQVIAREKRPGGLLS